MAKKTKLNFDETPFVKEVKSLFAQVEAKRDFKVIKRLLKEAKRSFSKKR